MKKTRPHFLSESFPEEILQARHRTDTCIDIYIFC